MPKYTIPVTYTMYGLFEIEAYTLEQALDKVFPPGNPTNIISMPMPHTSGPVGIMDVTVEDILENNTQLTKKDKDYIEDFVSERNDDNQ